MTAMRISWSTLLTSIALAAAAAFAAPELAAAQEPDAPAETRAAGEPAETPAAGDAAAPVRQDELRLRYGGSLALGFGFVSSPQEDLTVQFDLHARIGAQLNDYFAVYYEPSLLIGPAFTLNLCVSGTCSSQEQTHLLHTSAAVAEVTLFDGLQIAAGPSAVIGAGDVGVVAGAGLTGRIGWTFGGMGTGTRQGFSIAIQPNGGWFFTDGGGGFWDITLALGWDSF